MMPKLPSFFVRVSSEAVCFHSSVPPSQPLFKCSAACSGSFISTQSCSPNASFLFRGTTRWTICALSCSVPCVESTSGTLRLDY